MSLPYHPCPDMTDEAPPPGDTAEMLEAKVSIERSQRHAAILARLADMGMEIAEALAGEVKKNPSPDLAAAFAKVAQAVRRTLALEDHFAKGLQVQRTDLFTKRETLWTQAARCCGNWCGERVRTETGCVFIRQMRGCGCKPMQARVTI